MAVANGTAGIDDLAVIVKGGKMVVARARDEVVANKAHVAESNSAMERARLDPRLPVAALVLPVYMTLILSLHPRDVGITFLIS